MPPTNAHRSPFSPSRFANTHRLLACAGAMLALSLTAAPGYQSLRFDEDYHELSDPARRTDALDFLKYIPVGASPEAYLSLGGEIRERYERYDHTQWGSGPQDSNGYLMQRYIAHADIHAGEHVRAFVQLRGAYVSDRNGGPRATDQDDFDVGQAFVDATWKDAAASTFTLRVGRQELAFGSSRLISPRESPNLRLSFQGVRGILKTRALRLDVFAVEGVHIRPGAFNDGTDATQKLWGIYAVDPFTLPAGIHTDWYYLGRERSGLRYETGQGDERRQTLGTRVWGKRAGWDYNFEFVYQFGWFRGERIQAWTAASDTGYTWSAPLRPRLSVKLDVASGDGNPHDGRLETFNPLYPRGAYFNESALIGPANLIDFHPALGLQLLPQLSATIDWALFWRHRLADGVYNASGAFVRRGAGNPHRYLGHQPSLTIEWHPERHWTLTGCVARFYSGGFFDAPTDARAVTYVSTWLTFKF